VVFSPCFFPFFLRFYSADPQHGSTFPPLRVPGRLRGAAGPQQPRERRAVAARRGRRRPVAARARRARVARRAARPFFDGLFFLFGPTGRGPGVRRCPRGVLLQGQGRRESARDLHAREEREEAQGGPTGAGDADEREGRVREAGIGRVGGGFSRLRGRGERERERRGGRLNEEMKRGRNVTRFQRERFFKFFFYKSFRFHLSRAWLELALHGEDEEPSRSRSLSLLLVLLLEFLPRAQTTS